MPLNAFLKVKANPQFRKKGINDRFSLSNDQFKLKLKKLQRLSRQLSHKQKGSNNHEKAKTKPSRWQHQIGCIRKDFLHKLTTNLVKQFDVICIENLNVKGMIKNHKLSCAISDLGFYEFKRQLIYKANMQGKTVKSVDRFYPSSKSKS